MKSADSGADWLEVTPTWIVVLLLVVWAVGTALWDALPFRKKAQPESRCPACEHPGKFPAGTSAIGCPYCGWESAP